MANGLMAFEQWLLKAHPARFDSSITPLRDRQIDLHPERCDLWKHVTLRNHSPLPSFVLVLSMFNPPNSSTAMIRPFAIVRLPAPSSPATTAAPAPAPTRPLPRLLFPR